MTLPRPETVADRLPDELPIHELGPGRKLVRIYQPRRGGWHAQRFFGPLGDMRFDHHPPPCRLHDGFSVWYASASVLGAVAEVFGRTRQLDRSAGQRVALATVERPLRVIDLLGAAARQLALTQENAASADFETCRAWARELYQRYEGMHGIRWRGRQSGSVCVLLDDRAAMDRLSARHCALGDVEVWPRIARSARVCRIQIV